MAWSITDRFPTWGETGEFPIDGFFYEGGDQVNEKHLDALWNGIKGLENETRSSLEDLDSNSDGVVDEADYANDADASTYKGNDLDSDGDGKVNAADDADTVGGEPPSNFADTNHGNEEHNTDFTTLTEVNNNADVPSADYADNAGDANTLNGKDASEITPTLTTWTLEDSGGNSISTRTYTPSGRAVVTRAHLEAGGNESTTVTINYNNGESTTLSLGSDDFESEDYYQYDFPTQEGTYITDIEYTWYAEFSTSVVKLAGTTLI